MAAVKAFRRAAERMPVIAVVQNPPLDQVRRLRQAGVFFLALDPVSADELRTALRDAYDSIRLGRANPTQVVARPGILIIDDDADFRASTQALLEAEGFAVSCARDGKEGVAKIKAAAPDLIVLDVMMEHDWAGYEVNWAVKYGDDLAGSRHVPILMISSVPLDPRDALRPRHRGTHGDPRQLPHQAHRHPGASSSRCATSSGSRRSTRRAIMVREHASEATGGPAAAGKALEAPASAGARKVLVIDDEDVMLLSCRRILEKAGYTVETFGCGQAGVERLGEWRPQVLLVDLKMPELDGFQVIERVRALDEDVVIVVITGYATIGTAVDAMKAGAYDFLPKPWTPDELRLVVARCHERWNLGQESKRLRREKEEAERRFVTFVSHQLKTPLVAVKQYLDVLLFNSRQDLPAQALEWIERSQERLREMLTLVEDWLTLARIERGALGTKAVRADLAAIATQVVQAAAMEAQAAGVTVGCELEPDLPRVMGDPVAVSTVVSNLVVNAIKYNHRGGGSPSPRRARAMGSS